LLNGDAIAQAADANIRPISVIGKTVALGYIVRNRSLICRPSIKDPTCIAV
jgi:hypothetical protein